MRFSLYLLALCPAALIASSKSAQTPADKFLNLPHDSYTLDGIVNAKQSNGFACAFGSFKVKVKSRGKNGIATALDGSGILINSGWLHKQVRASPDITYLFPAGAKIDDGTRVSAFCNDQGTRPGEASIVYYVTERAKGDGASALQIRQGDIQTEVDGVRLDHPDQGLEAFQKLHQKPSAKVEVLRDGREVTLGRSK